MRNAAGREESPGGSRDRMREMHLLDKLDKSEPGVRKWTKGQFSAPTTTSAFLISVSAAMSHMFRVVAMCFAYSLVLLQAFDILQNRASIINSVRFHSIVRSPICVAPQRFFSSWMRFYLARPTAHIFWGFSGCGVIVILLVFSLQHMMSSLRCADVSGWAQVRSGRVNTDELQRDWSHRTNSQDLSCTFTVYSWNILAGIISIAVFTVTTKRNSMAECGFSPLLITETAP